VSLRTGAINWELGGKESSFTEQAAPGQALDSANEIFAWQHDPEYIGHGEFTLLFNAEFPAGVNSYRAYRAPWFPPGGPGGHG
jgi:hypothetical protein